MDAWAKVKELNKQLKEAKSRSERMILTSQLNRWTEYAQKTKPRKPEDR